MDTPDPQLIAALGNTPGNFLERLTVLEQKVEELQAADTRPIEEIIHGKTAVYAVWLSPTDGVLTTDPADVDYSGIAVGSPGWTFGGKTYGVIGVKDGELQFGLSQEDGTAVAGGGAVVLDSEGITLPDGGDAIELSDSFSRVHSHFFIQDGSLRILNYAVSSESNVITNGDFETGDLTGWTETDPSGKVSVQQVDGSYVLAFDNNPTTSEYIEQTVSTANGRIVTLRARSDNNGVILVYGLNGGTEIYSAYTFSEWRNFIFVFGLNTTTIRIAATVTGSLYIDDIVVRSKVAATAATIKMGSGGVYIEGTQGKGIFLNIQGSLQVDSIVNDTGLAHGTYNPTLTNSTNVDSSVATDWDYIRLGDKVLVTGLLQVDCTASGTFLLYASLPPSITSNFTVSTDVSGNGTNPGTGVPNIISIREDAAHPTPGRFQLDGYAQVATNLFYRIVAMYKVKP